jgi:hypothetical protein
MASQPGYRPWPKKLPDIATTAEASLWELNVLGDLSSALPVWVKARNEVETEIRNHQRSRGNNHVPSQAPVQRVAALA